MCSTSVDIQLISRPIIDKYVLHEKHPTALTGALQQSNIIQIEISSNAGNNLYQ